MLIPEPEDMEVIKKLDFKQPSTWIATWGGLGFLNPGPGTWGSLGAIPFGIIAYSVGNIIALAILTGFILYIGLWAAERFEKRAGVHDSKMIVVDEVVGQLIALMPAAASPSLVFLSFIFFRAFDIWKPGPIGTIDKKMPGARGVMADDILAGIAAALCVLALKVLGIG